MQAIHDVLLIQRSRWSLSFFVKHRSECEAAQEHGRRQPSIQPRSGRSRSKQHRQRSRKPRRAYSHQ